jgi:hypothetical protein
MKSSKFLNTSKDRQPANKQGGFANFFLYASGEEKKRVFKEVARRANADQRKILERSRVGVK